MSRHVNISEARRQLFELFEEVTTNKRLRIVIGHRDSEEEAVLLSRHEVERLERRASSSDRRSEFALVGTATLRSKPEDVLKDVRAAQNLLSAEKLDGLMPRR